METRWIKKSVCLVCLGSLMVLGPGTGQTAAGKSQSGAASVLDRVQSETDPELSELIRIAVTNRKNVNEQERLEIVRKITQSHAQIKLLDQQIEQVARKIDSNAGPAELRSELVLAKAELESKRTTEMANLRELMGVIPRFPFSPQPVKTLSTWLRLNVIDQRVYVTDTLKPFSEYWARDRFKSLGLLSEKETLDLLRERLKDRNNLPIRVDIHHTPAMSNAAGGLRDAILDLMVETDSQMQAEVRLQTIMWVGSGTSPFYLRQDRIAILHAADVRRPDGGPKPLVTGMVDPNDIEQHILWRLLHPGNVPLTFRIEYDEPSANLAKRVADTAKTVAKRLGIAELVEVVGTLVEPVPETGFLGRWEAIGKGEVQIVDVQPGGVCQLTRGEGSESAKAGMNVSGTWVRTAKEIIIDTKEGLTGNIYYVYRGYLDRGKHGNLVFDKGVIDRQGGFGASNPQPAIFKKVQ